MGYTEKTDYLIETKGLLKDRINSLGGSITSGTTFRDYLVWLDSLYEALEEKTITGLPDSLEGKCEQDGTPTPDSPVPINITTGRQVVSVKGSGNQLFNKNYPNILSDTYIATAQSKILQASKTKTLFIKIEGGKTYTVSKIVSARFAIATTSTFPGINTSLLEYKQNNSATSLTITTSENAKYLCVFFLHSSDTLTEQEILDSIMINEGTTALSYEKYNGNDYELNLGKNLLDIPDKTATSNGITLTTTNGITTLNGTASANSFLNFYNSSSPLYLEAGTYTLSANNPVSAGGNDGQNGIRLSKSDGTLITGTTCTMNTINAKITFTITEPTTCFLQARTQSGTIYDNFEIKPQLEKGTGTSYSPYKTPIYLGKIGTYQDYIFRNTTENPLYDSTLEEGQWYIHKEIGKKTLTNTSGWSKISNASVNTYNAPLGDTPYRTNSTALYLSNYFKEIAVDNRYQDLTFFINAGNYVVVSYNDKTSVSGFNTWISTHPLEVYYVLATPTNTLIEDEELINQLNEIEIFTVISEDFYN